MQKLGSNLPYGKVPGAWRSNVRLFLVFIYTWQEDVAKIPKVPGAPRNVYLAQAITSLVGITTYCTIITIHLHFTSFEKNYLGKMLFEQIIEIRVSGAPSPYMYSYNWLFS